MLIASNYIKENDTVETSIMNYPHNGEVIDKIIFSSEKVELEDGFRLDHEIDNFEDIVIFFVNESQDELEHIKETMNDKYWEYMNHMHYSLINSFLEEEIDEKKIIDIFVNEC
jgi:hypothetical protein